MSLILRRYKPPKADPKRDAAYLRWLRSLPCLVCPSTLRIEAAHVGERGLGQKCPDRQAIPLCEYHHRTGAHSHHALGRKFWSFWHVNRHEAIRRYNRIFLNSNANKESY